MTILDSFFIEIGFRPLKGQKEAEEGFKRTEQAAQHMGSSIDTSAKTSSSFLSELQGRVLGLLAAFTAGKGLKDFIEDQVRSNAAMGRLAYMTDTAISTLSSWQNILQLSGGSAADFNGTLKGLVGGYQEWVATGESSVIPYMRALGVWFTDAGGRVKGISELLLEFADRVQGMDPARASFLLSRVGLDPTTISIVLQGRKAVMALLAEQQRLGVVTKQDTLASLALQHAWGALEQSSNSLGRTLLTSFAPILVKVLDTLTAFVVWARQHQPFLQATFLSLVAVVGAVALSFTGLLIPSIIAAAIAIGLLYDDWKVWTDGGKSAFAGFWQFFSDKWGEARAIVGPVYEWLKSGFLDVVNTLGDLVRAFVALFTGSPDQIRTAWTKLFGDLTKDMQDFVVNARNILLGLFDPTALIPDDFGVKLLEGMGDAMGDIQSWLIRRAAAVLRSFGPSKSGGSGTIDLSTAGGLNELVGGQEIPDVGQALLKIISKPESHGAYNLRYGGVDDPKGRGITFSDFSHHPNIRERIPKGQPHAGEYSTAAGRYQFTYSTWMAAARALGLKDFSPANQDRAAWWYAQQDYRGATGRDLTTDLKSHDPAILAAVGRALAPTWYTLPGSLKKAWAQNMLAHPSTGTPLAIPQGAALAAATHNTHNNQRTNTFHAETRIGTINVQAPDGADADSFAGSLSDAIENNAFAASANFGMR